MEAIGELISIYAGFVLVAGPWVWLCFSMGVHRND